MAITFPGSPTNGQVYSPGGGGPNYIYNSTYSVWQVNASKGGFTNASLTGLSTATATSVVATDTVLIGMGKIQAEVNVDAPLDSPNFTGVPAAPTATAGTSTTQIATTGFVTTALTNALANVAPVMDGTATIGVSTLAARQDHVHPSDTVWGNNAGRNKLHNALFNIAQRGTGPWTTNGAYTADRWILLLNGGDTASMTLVSLSDADRTAIGDEEAVTALQCTFTGTSNSNAYSIIGQRLENLYSLANKTVTVSFWAKATSGTPKIGFYVGEFYGVGGTGEVDTTTVIRTISTTWTRYSGSLSVASNTGVTLGTNGFALLDFYFSGQTPGMVQSGTILMWGVQLEIGSAATALEKRDYTADYLDCQRFYQTVVANAALSQFFCSTSATGNYFAITIPPMRTNPTATITLVPGGNFASYSIYTTSIDAITAIIFNTVAGNTNFFYSYTASADL